MFIPSTRAEWSFCKSSDASVFSLPSSVTGFDKVICGCVRIHSLSCLIRSASFLSLTQFSTYFRYRKTFLSTALCVTFQPPSPTPIPTRIQTVCGRAHQHGLFMFLASVYLALEILLLIEGATGLSWWHPGRTVKLVVSWEDWCLCELSLTKQDCICLFQWAETFFCASNYIVW